MTGQVIFESYSDIVLSVCMSSDGSKIVSGSDDNTVKVRNEVTIIDNSFLQYRMIDYHSILYYIIL